MLTNHRLLSPTLLVVLITFVVCVGLSTQANNDPANKGYAMTFTHLGRRGYNITLYAPTWVSRRKWVEHIESQQRIIWDRSSIFTNVVVCENIGSNKVNCAVAFGIVHFRFR